MERVLFVCTGNAGRSQMAEAMFRELTAGAFDVLSAGVDPWDDLHPMARKLMAERGLDLAGHYPQHVREFVDEDLDAVVTIGDRAGAESPDFRTGTRRLHWPVDDPADADGTPDSEAVFRSTCGRIEARLAGLRQLLNSLPCRRDSAWAPAMSTAAFRPARFQPAVHIPLLVEAGFRHIELCCYMDHADFPWESAADVAELKRVAGDCGATLMSVHPPDRGNLAAAERSAREIQIDVLRRSVDLAAELGAASLSTHVGYGLPPDDARPAALARQDETLDELEAYVLSTPVAICLETLTARESDTPNAQLVDLTLRRPAAGFGFVLDTGHSNIAGDLEGLAEKVGRRLLNLHLNDNDGRGDQHLVPYGGTIEWTPFMQGLRNSGYEGPLTLEVYVRDSADLRDELARCRETVERLRSCCA